MDFVARRWRGTAPRRSGQVRHDAGAGTARSAAPALGDDLRPRLRIPRPDGGYTYNPAGTSWTFSGNSGIEANGMLGGRQPRSKACKPRFCKAVVRVAPASTARSARRSTSPPAAATDSSSTLPSGNPTTGSSRASAFISTVRWSARTTPASPIVWSTFGVELNVAAAGNHTLAFQAVNSSGDQERFLDDLTIDDYSPPTVATIAAATPNPLSGTTTGLSVLARVAWAKAI